MHPGHECCPCVRPEGELERRAGLGSNCLQTPLNPISSFGAICFPDGRTVMDPRVGILASQSAVFRCRGDTDYDVLMGLGHNFALIYKAL